MTLNCVKLGHAVTFMKHLASVVSLIFITKTLTWNRITYRASNSLNFAELLENELLKSICKNFTNIPFSIQYVVGLIVKTLRAYN